MKAAQPGLIENYLVTRRANSMRDVVRRRLDDVLDADLKPH
jgi:hypothetical protein